MGDAQIRFMCMDDAAILSDQAIDWRLEPFIAYFKVSDEQSDDGQGALLFKAG